jgi:hypothetical protein
VHGEKKICVFVFHSVRYLISPIENSVSDSQHDVTKKTTKSQIHIAGSAFFQLTQLFFSSHAKVQITDHNHFCILMKLFFVFSDWLDGPDFRIRLLIGGAVYSSPV